MTRQAGFTLLEMLLVVFILAALAAATSSMVDDAHQHARVDDTRNRLDALRRGISGTDLPTGPITGFVADMGRTPTTIRELLEDTTTTPYTVDSATGVGSGWRGPYVSALPGSSGRLELWDGFGNVDEVLATADPDFGWLLDEFDPLGDPHPVLGAMPHLQLDAGDLRIASLGADAALTATDAANAIKIDQAEHRVDLGPWSVDVTFTVVGPLPASVRGLALRVWEPDGAGGVVSRVGDLDGSSNDFGTLIGSSPGAGSPYTVPLNFRTQGTNATWVSHGVRAVELCYLDMTGAAQPLSPPQFRLIELRARASLPIELRRTFEIGTPP